MPVHFTNVGDFGLAEYLTEELANNVQMVLIDRTDR